MPQTVSLKIFLKRLLLKLIMWNGMTCPLRGVAAQANDVRTARGTLMTDDLTCNQPHTLVTNGTHFKSNKGTKFAPAHKASLLSSQTV